MYKQLEKDNVWDTIKINVAKCLKNLSSGWVNEKQHLYSHTTKVNWPSPLQTKQNICKDYRAYIYTWTGITCTDKDTFPYSITNTKQILLQNKFTKTKDWHKYIKLKYYSTCDQMSYH